MEPGPNRRNCVEGDGGEVEGWGHTLGENWLIVDEDAEIKIRVRLPKNKQTEHSKPLKKTKTVFLKSIKESNI